MIVSGSYDYYQIENAHMSNNLASRRFSFETFQELLRKAYDQRSTKTSQYSHKSIGTSPNRQHHSLKCTHCPDKAQRKVEAVCLTCSVTHPDKLYCSICWNQHVWGCHNDLILS